MRYLNYTILILLIFLAGCKINSSINTQPPAGTVLNQTNSSVRVFTLLVRTNQDNVIKTVTISWTGAYAILIQGATNLLNPTWFDVANVAIFNGDTNSDLSCSIPVTFNQEFFRGVGEVILGWDASTSDNVLGYKIYYGTNSNYYIDTYDAGTNLFAIVPSLDSPVNYFAATSYGTNEESYFSNEATYTNKEIRLMIK